MCLASAHVPCSASEAPAWRFDFDAVYSELTGDLDPWREAGLRVAYRADEAITVAGAIEMASRFDAFDAYLEARLDARVGPGTWIHLLGGGTPDADFRPRVAFGGGGAQRLFKDDGFAGAIVATLDARYADYAAGDVETANPGVEVYLARGRVWLTARHINLWDETGKHRTGYFARADVQPVEDCAVFGGYAAAPDTSEGVTMDTTGWFGGVTFDIDAEASVRLAVAQEMRDLGYDRTTVSLALTLKRGAW